MLDLDVFMLNEKKKNTSHTSLSLRCVCIVFLRRKISTRSGFIFENETTSRTYFPYQDICPIKLIHFLAKFSMSLHISVIDHYHLFFCMRRSHNYLTFFPHCS